MWWIVDTPLGHLGMVWYGMVWYGHGGPLWYGMVHYLVVVSHFVECRENQLITV